LRYMLCPNSLDALVVDEMNRRDFVWNALRAAAAGSVVGSTSLLAARMSHGAMPLGGMDAIPPKAHDLGRHRFGVNYTPSKNWWFCWNQWDADPIKGDLDAIASLGADHLRILLIWPYFQPNPKWISPLHLDRLDQLLTLMGERELDALVTVFTGQLSGWFFLPPFNKIGTEFYSDEAMWAAQELFIHQLARVINSKNNIIGFDVGNEINTCWTTEPRVGDPWMKRLLSLMASLCPEGLHVNGVDQGPWFEVNTFSPQLLAAAPMPVIHCYPYWSGALKYGGAMDPPSTKLLAAMAALARSYAGDPRKPIWAEEFNTCIEALNEKQQAEWLEKAVLAAIDSGVSWFSYWDSHDVDRKFEFNSLEYSLGLLTNDGRVKEQGKVFKQLAATYRGKPVNFPAHPLPPPPVNRNQETSWRWMLDWLGWKPAGA
jgi:Cellulase (glycosyl hydrolase family 5)